MEIRMGDLGDRRVLNLIRTHLETAHCSGKEGSAHALGAIGLAAPGIVLWTAWDGDVLLGIAALKRLSTGQGEIKSMHVARERRRAGTGAALLRHLIAIAGERGMRKTNLETGSREYFGPARAFYRAHGFRECGPFGNYVPDGNSVFMSLELATAETGGGFELPSH